MKTIVFRDSQKEDPLLESKINLSSFKVSDSLQISFLVLSQFIRIN